MRTDWLLTRFAPQLHPYPQPSTFFLFLNTRLRPFDDPRVRRAVAYAVDRERIARLLQGPLLAQPTCQLLPPGFPGYRPYCPYTAAPSANGLWRAPDLAAAKRLVGASGTVGTRIVVWGFPPYGPVSRYIVSLLDRLGYHASLKLVSLPTFFSKAADSANRVQAGAYYWQTDYPAASNMLAVQLSCDSFQPRSAANLDLSEFCNRRIDRAMHRASVIQATTPGAAAPLWATVDRRLVDEAPVVPLVNFRGVDFVSRRLGNYEHHPIYGVLLDQAWVR